MQIILLEATDVWATLADGSTEARLWRGVTAAGAPVLAAVVGIAAPQGAVAAGPLLKASVPPVQCVGTEGRTVLRTWTGDIAFGGWWV